MNPSDSGPDLRDRFDGFAARVGERLRKPASGSAALQEDYWATVRELFTRDVTSGGFDQLVRHDAGETLRFFLRDVELAPLLALPWYRRYPQIAFKVFLAMAYRLSPVRRVLFAVGLPLLALGWLRYAAEVMLDFAGRPVRGASWEHALLLGGSLAAVLLLLELRDKLSLKGDLEVARQIQFGLLPFEPARVGGLSLHAAMRPANTVGGDYFDRIELPEGRLAIVLGDVAGKGMPAALLMALLQGSLRTLLNAGFRGAALVDKLNAHLHASIPSNRLVTLFYAEVDPQSGALRYVNAGHNPPLLVRADGSVARLDATGIALGILSQTPYEEPEAHLAAGDRLLLYTDGVTEAANLQDDEYGDARLESFLKTRRDTPAEALLAALRDDVLAFCGPVRPRDDMTMLLVERQA